MGALDHAPRDGQNQRHGHVGRVLGEDAGRIGDGDATLDGGGDINIIDAVAEIGDQPQLVPGLGEERAVDPVGDGGHQHVSRGYGGRELRSAHRRVRFIQAGLE